MHVQENISKHTVHYKKFILDLRSHDFKTLYSVFCALLDIFMVFSNKSMCAYTLWRSKTLLARCFSYNHLKKYLYHFVWPDQPLCSALSEYRYNIKPQCRAWSPFEQFTCAFLHPVPRHLSRDTPCNYKWEKKRNVFWLFPILIAYIYYSVC